MAVHIRIIRELDERFRINSNLVSLDEMGAYRDAVNVAKAEAVRQADVILCTCISSSSSLLQQCTNIQQVRTVYYSHIIIFLTMCTII